MATTTTRRSGADPLSLDPSTAGGLLDGRVVEVVAALRAPATAEELRGEAAAVAAFAKVGPKPAPKKGSMWSRTKIKGAVAVLVGGFTLTTGLAAAGALPGPVQSAASSAFEKVGISVPDPEDDDTGDNGDDNEVVDQAPAPVVADEPAEPAESTEAPKDNHGDEVSETARTTDAEGREKGAEVSGVASDGKSRAGAERPAPERGKAPPEAKKPNKP